jgi:hypothetical protein
MMPQKPTDKSAIFDLVLDVFGPEIRSWRGEQPLKKVFWGYGVLASTGLGALYALSIYGDQIALQQALLPCMAGYAFWLVVSLWRSSKPVMNTFWGALARQLAVVWALNAFMILAFLQLELIGTYLHYRDVLSVPTVREDGATISVDFTVVPPQNAGEMIGIAALARDARKPLRPDACIDADTCRGCEDFNQDALTV